MDRVGSVPCESFLVGRNCAYIHGTVKDSAMSSSVFCSVYEFGMASGSLSARVQSYAPILLKDWHGASGNEAF